MLRQFANNADPASASGQARANRFRFFLSLLNSVDEPYRILDVGGTQEFWEGMGWEPPDRCEVCLMNLEAPIATAQRFKGVSGDARDLREFADHEFDVIFSNSVIEHVGTLREQRQMALAVQRVGKRYFVQTPNRHFPLEPHFLLPCFQYAPQWFRARCLQLRTLGWVGRQSNFFDALVETESIRLLNHAELRWMFPRSKIYLERIAGLTKSMIAYDGFGSPP